MGDYKKKPYHAAVICAKPEELRAVVKQLKTTWTMGQGEELSHQVFEVERAGSKEPSRIMVATCGSMGNLSAATRTAQIITNHQPGVLIFTGTAASMNTSQVQIGDVVVPRKAVRRTYEKITERGQRDFEERVVDGFKEIFFDETALLSDISTVACSEDSQGIIGAMDIDAIELESGSLGLFTVDDQPIHLRKPKVNDDVNIFSCGMVVDSRSYRQFLKTVSQQHMRKTDVIDMESYGFFSAIASTRTYGAGNGCTGVMIRGISDYAGRKQQTEELPDAWKAIALRNAATVTHHCLESLLNR